MNPVIVDNCDPNPTLDPIVGISPSVDDNGNIIFTVTLDYTVTDASGNSNQEVYVYTRVEEDNEAPLIDAVSTTISDTVNICNEFPINEEVLGLIVTDNCTDSVQVSITISDENGVVVDSINGPGNYTVEVVAVDDSGNEANEIINVSLAPNAANFSVSAGDDNFNGASGNPVTFFSSDLLVNDAASDGSDLEVQEVSLVNPGDGTLVDNADGSYTFTPSPGFTGDVQLTYVVKSEDESLYFGDNGHFYEFIPQTGISWENARDAAAARTLNGLQGYLATVTSQEENDFIQTKLQGTGWMGGSDEEEEGVWKWVTGPEAGTVFWNGDGSGMVANGLFANWDPNAGSTFPAEPNNDFGFGTNPDGENYAHFRTDGLWNDWPNAVPPTFGTIQGYVVEYSGPNGCVPPNFTATGNITISYSEAILGNDEENSINAIISPNPFHTEAKLSVTVPEDGPVIVELRDLRGQIIQSTNYYGVKDVKNDIFIQRDNVANGIYMITVRTATELRTIRTVITR